MGASSQGGRRGRRTDACIALVGVVALLLGAALERRFDLLAHPGDLLSSPGWWVTVAAFAGTEYAVLNVERGKDTFTLSLSEVAMTAALPLVSPAHLVTARVLGGAIGLLLRRQPVLKLAVNLSSFWLEALVAAVVYRAAGPAGPHEALAAVVGAVAAALLAAGAAQHAVVLTAMAVSAGGLSPAGVLRLLTAIPVNLVTGMPFGLLVMGAVRFDGAEVPVVAAVVAVVAAAYRGYGALRQRHRSLEVLYEFTRQLGSSSRDSAHQLGDVLTAVARLLRAESAAVLLLDAEGARGTRAAISEGGEVRTEPYLPTTDDWPWVQVSAPGSACLLAPAGTRDPAMREWLTRAGRRDAVLTALPGPGRPAGALAVFDRLGDVATFTGDDARLLQTVAAQVATAIENSRLLQRLDHDSRHDQLTGLLNRTAFNAELERALGDGAPVAVLLLDLDRFKEINDTLGHHCGDLLLQQIARRLLPQSRRSDVLARLGGDEFALLLRDCVHDEALTAARRIATTLSRPLLLDDVQVQVEASIGVALAPEHADTATVLMQRADVAMYTAKRAGTGVESYDSELDEYSPRRLALATELRQAIASGQLELHYQPQVGAADGRVVAAEALLRWNHPLYGRIPPDEFIPVAEQTSQMRELTFFVLRSAVLACRGWRERGLSLAVAVNVSVRNLLELDLPEVVAGLLAEHGLPPSALTLEITESQIMADPERTLRVLRALDAIGVRLSVDDFGTGYSSLAYLRLMPVRELKIDRSFVRDLANDSGNQAIVRTVLSLAASLDLEVVAEGVEDEVTARRLARMGCGLLQGYHIARPMTGAALEDWLGQPQPVVPAQRTGAEADEQLEGRTA